MAAESKLKELAQQRGKSEMEVFCEEFYKHGSRQAMAAALEVAPSTIKYWMMSLGLTERAVLVQMTSGLQLTAKARLAIGREK